MDALVCHAWGKQLRTIKNPVALHGFSHKEASGPRASLPATVDDGVVRDCIRLQCLQLHLLKPQPSP